MQKLNVKIIETAKKEKMQNLEAEMREVILTHEAGEIFICPFCNYEGTKKNKKGSAKLFQDSTGKFFKCFFCGIWRKI